MKMRKTRDDFQALEQIYSQDVGWNEALAVMLDILLDIREESQKELNELTFSAEALQKWRTIANTLLSIPMEKEVKNLSERSKQRIDAYSKQLEEYTALSESSHKEIQIAAEKENSLRAQMEAFEKELAKLKARKRTAAELGERIESLKNEIGNLRTISVGELERLQHQLIEEKREKQDLLDKYQKASASLQILTDECESLKTDSNEILRKIDAAKQRKYDAELTMQQKNAELQDDEKTYRDLMTSLASLDEKIDRQKESVKGVNEEIVNKNVELQELLRQGTAAQSELDNTVAQLQTAKAKRDDLLTRHQQLQSEFGGIIAQIANLQSESPDLKKRLEEQKALLEEERNKQNGEIQLLSDQVSELNERVGEANAKISELSIAKNSAEEEFARREKTSKEISADIEKVKLQLAETEKHCIELNGQKEDLLNRRRLYESDIKEYEAFFDSEECRRVRLEIRQYRAVIDEYQAAVSELFQTKGIVFSDKLVELAEPFQKKKNNLRNELNEIQDSLDHLNTDYLRIIQEVEERVSL